MSVKVESLVNSITVDTITNTIEVTQDQSFISISAIGDQGTKGIKGDTGEQGPVGPVGPDTDTEIIALAQTTDSTLSYTGDNLTGIAYADGATITLNAKILAYALGVLDSITQTFTYSAQVWTVTTSLGYTTGKLTSKTITVGKV
tara:strand:- start:49 stop:483 length:435 start_codon:yes stop_codon:yes gene_type:complete